MLRCTPRPAKTAPPYRTVRAFALMLGRPLPRAHAPATLNLRHDPALRIEELLGHLVPAAKVIDGKEHTRRREMEGLGHTGEHRPIPVLAEQSLSGDRLREAHECARRGCLGAFAGHGDRILDQDG